MNRKFSRQSMNISKKNHADLSKMEPLKVTAPTRILRKKCSSTRLLQEPVMEVENTMKTEGVVDLDAIPSSIIGTVSPTMVEE
jgi:hypothetical protein